MMWIFRAESRLAPSQWEAALLCNDASHWLGTSLESALSIGLADGTYILDIKKLPEPMVAHLRVWRHIFYTISEQLPRLIFGIIKFILLKMDMNIDIATLGAKGLKLVSLILSFSV